MSTETMQRNYSLPLLFESAGNAWTYILQEIVKLGSDEQARGLLFRELIGFSSAFSMTAPVVTHPMRKLSMKYAFGEAWWILSGKDDVESIAAYNSKIRNYSDDGKKFFGAYGPPLTDQLPYVADLLARDLGSRQGVVTIWRPKPPSTKDVPCTVTLQFLVRQNQLICIDTMRSSDAWLGWPYDVFTFSCVSAYLLLMLRERGVEGLDLGPLIMQCGSQHLYLNDLPKAHKIFEYQGVSPLLAPLVPYEFKSPNEFLAWLSLRAESLRLGVDFNDPKTSLK